MKAVEAKNEKGEVVGYFIQCPGCRERHYMSTKVHTFSGTLESPTFLPSIGAYGKVGESGWKCHSYVRDGMIQFLDDSKHELAGQTVPLPDVELLPRRIVTS